MNKQRKALATFLSVILANCLYAGFLDGLKKVGEGVADVAGGVVNTTVNTTTSVVQSVKQQTVFANPQTNVTATVQTVPTDVPAPAPAVTPVSAPTVISAQASAVPTVTPAPAPVVVPASAPVVEPAKATVPTPQKTERKGSIATENDDIFSGNKHRSEKKHLAHSQDERNDQSDSTTHGDKRSGNSAMSVYQQFINDEFKPKIKVIEQELARRERAFRETYWFKGVYSHKELGRYESGQSELALKRLREIANGDDAEFRKLKSDASAWSYAGESLMQPWNYGWSPKRREPYFSHGNGQFNIYLPDNPDTSLPYLDGADSRIGSLDNLSNWIERTKVWLARESEIVYKECSISELSAKRIAELHGRPDYKPFTVYKDIAFGDSVIDVFEKLKKVDNDAQWIRATRNDDQAGETINMYLHGKRLYTKVLSRHGLDFTFGSFAPDEGSVLTGVEMDFKTTPPPVEALVAKYNVDGAKVEKMRDIIDRKWPETEMGQFGLMLFNALERKAKAVEGKNGSSSIYRKDMLAISENHCKGKPVEKTVVTTDNVTISICENVEAHKVIKVTFEDALLAAKLKELCIKQKETDEKAEADAKAAAEKKAKSDSLNF